MPRPSKRFLMVVQASEARLFPVTRAATSRSRVSTICMRASRFALSHSSMAASFVGVDPEPEADPDVDFPDGDGGIGVGRVFFPSAYPISPRCSRTKVTCIFHTSQFEPSSFSRSILSNSFAFSRSEGADISIYTVLRDFG